MNQTLIIIRGIPGSGKSTMAKKLLTKYNIRNHYEADMFFMKNGKYIYDRNKIAEAHAWCLKSTANAIQRGESCIVSNTFTTIKEIKPYLKLAKENNFNVVVLRMINNYGNIHNVPNETLKKMLSRFEDYNGEIKIS